MRETVSIGFFEGGEYVDHSAFRDQYITILRRDLPPQYELRLAPSGFKSADWDRETSRRMARELAADTAIDVVVALGPWTIEDLIDAGFDRPIIGALRFAPQLEGLVDERGDPRYDNLSLRLRPTRFDIDMRATQALFDARTVGVLIFPSGDETDTMLTVAKQALNSVGADVVTAAGRDLKGTYAFFKAYQNLPDDVDALYVGPLWGMDAVKINEFYRMVARERIPLVTGAGPAHVARGALLTTHGEAMATTAYFHAWKTIEIIQGALPSSLPTRFDETILLTVNQALHERLDLNVYAAWDGPVARVDVPRGDPDLSINLQEAIMQAVQLNPGYQAVRERIDAATAAVSGARRQYLPQVGLTGIAGYRDNNTVHNHFDEIDNRQYRLTLGLEQPLLALETLKDIELNRIEQSLAQTDEQAARMQLQQAVTLAYLTFLETVKRIEVAATYRDRLRAHLQTARLQQQLGTGSLVDVYRLQDEYNIAEQTIELAETDWRLARTTLNLLMNQPASTAITPDSSAFVFAATVQAHAALASYLGRQEVQERVTDLLVQTAIEQHPSIAGARLKIAFRSTLVEKNSQSFLPRIGLQARFNLADERPDPPVLDEKHTSWEAGLRLELPLFLGGSRFKAREELRERLSAEEYARDAATLDLVEDLRSSVARLAAILRNLPLAGNRVEATSQLQDETMISRTPEYRLALALIDTERRGHNARLDLSHLRYELHRESARLLTLLGLLVDGAPAPVTQLTTEIARRWQE